MTKKNAVSWIVIFLILIISPTFTFFFLGKYVDTTNYENRNAADKPVLTIDNLTAFPEEYEAYYNDNIPYRNQLLRLNNSIDYYLFHQAADKNIVIGKDGWLFYCDEEHGNAVEQSLGYWRFSEKDLQAIADNLIYTERILASQGIEFVLFLPPSKESIYTDKIPDYYRRISNYTCVDQVVDYLKEHTDIRIVYPKERLMQTRKTHENLDFYHKLDTHWNNVGAYIGALSLTEEMGLTMPSLDEVTLRPIYSDTGDLAQMLSVTIKNGDVDYGVSGISTNIAECEKNDFYTEFIYHTTGADERRLFVWRDSFSTALAPILASQFDESIFVHRESFKQNQIFDYGADIFVVELVTRNIDTLLKYFRISLVDSIIENDGSGNKNISLTRAIADADYSNVSISRRVQNSNEEIEYQSLQPFENFSLQVPESEKGEICFRIYGDEKGEYLLEERVIIY